MARFKHGFCTVGIGRTLNTPEWLFFSPPQPGIWKVPLVFLKIREQKVILGRYSRSVRSPSLNKGKHVKEAPVFFNDANSTCKIAGATVFTHLTIARAG